MTERIDAGARSIASHLRREGFRVVSWVACALDETPDGRYVVAYSVRFRNGRGAARSERVIGKFYNDDTGRQCYENMKSVEAKLDQGGSPCLLAVPRALHYDQDLGLLVQQYVTGTPYTELTQSDRYPRYLHAAGRALGCLHDLDPPQKRAVKLADHIAELVRPHPTELARHFPEYRTRIDACLNWMLRQETEWIGRLAPTLIHRDFHLRQLFHSDPRVWLVDWDCLAVGDPAFDVAYFVVYLKNHLAEDCIERGVDAFLSGYFSVRPCDFEDRLPVYESFNYLRRACRRFRLKDADWESQLHRMLERI